MLTTYRRDGTAAPSPAWFHFQNRAFEIVVAKQDVKLEHLERRPECSLVVFETVPPFRGVRVEGQPAMRTDENDEVRTTIASRYLGGADGRRFVDQRKESGVVLHLDAKDARIWDLAVILPSPDSS